MSTKTLEVHYLIFARFRGSKFKYDTRQIQSLLVAQMDKSQIDSPFPLLLKLVQFFIISTEIPQVLE